MQEQTLDVPSDHDVLGTQRPCTNPVVSQSSPPTLAQPNDIVSLSLGDLRRLLQEVSSQPVTSSAPAVTQNLLQLSPASVTPLAQAFPAAPVQGIAPQMPPRREPSMQPTLQSLNQPIASQPQQDHAPLASQLNADAVAGPFNGGNYQNLFHSPLSSLPPLSPSLIKAMKEKDFIDFNKLLPCALYDSSPTPNYLLQVQQGDQGEGSLSLTQTRRQTQKISGILSWIEAWNVYVRGMVHFHPHLATEMLAYQEAFCNLNKSYPFRACSQYDIAFRMKMARNKAASWALTDDYAFNRFLRCAPPVASQVTCYRCRVPGHLANACPNQANTNENRFFRTNTGATLQRCRHFNNNNRCTNPACPFPHQCKQCGGAHPVSDCKQIKSHF